ncbi:hypothetical protein [Paenibacillus lentus]|uniref:YegS/DAGK C-terminal domain-containing protein n=1 Tax=Paenibacillus lentus TaxID=1338368 RepID=A0A3Q8S658_9BACL|nr:hypothetical protein [Paenibacillus lentus]AZK48039.1 hypothetical protein EIM92_19250 [Paenibacillus lentus]
MTELYSPAWLTAITSVPSYDGGLKICPEAHPSDGQLDIYIVLRQINAAVPIFRQYSSTANYIKTTFAG